MSELIHQFLLPFVSQQGQYAVRAQGEERDDGTWVGWLEFSPDEPGGAVLRTEQETSQPNRQALEYWVGGLEPVYLEGTFERARLRQPAPDAAG